MTLLTFLKKNENTRKLFGKRELKIIEKQLYGLNLTQSEKNRLSRDIRKKFVFINQAAKYEEEFSLQKGAIIKELITEVKETILRDKWFRKIKKIIVYGSVVRNELTFRSDIAVIFETITPKEATQFRIRILGKFSEKVDVQVYNVLPEKIKKEIDKEGKVIYAKQ